MSEAPKQLFFTKEHEWMERIAPGTVRIGISDFAACELGDIVFVELPDVGADVRAGDSLGTIESVKTVSDLFSPVSGTVVKVNAGLLDQPELVNEAPFDGGWMVEIALTDEGEEEIKRLLTEAEYHTYISLENE